MNKDAETCDLLASGIQLGIGKIDHRSLERAILPESLTMTSTIGRSKSKKTMPGGAGFKINITK